MSKSQMSQWQQLVRRTRLAPLAYTLGHQEFREDYLQSALFAELRQNLLVEMSEVFSQRGLCFCLLKGMSYCNWLYADPAERPMGDIDILVPRQEFAAALTQLKHIGFSPRPSKRVHLADAHHAMTLDRGRHSVDLHRSMIQPWRSDLSMSQIWSRVTGTGTIRKLELLDEIVLHLAHIGRHELVAGPLAYIDLHRLVQRVGAQRAGIIRRAQRFGLGRVTTCAFEILDALRDGGRAHSSGGVRWLSSSREVLYLEKLGRIRQLLCKAVLVDNPRHFIGLLGIAALERWPGNWRR